MAAARTTETHVDCQAVYGKTDSFESQQPIDRFPSHGHCPRLAEACSMVHYAL